MTKWEKLTRDPVAFVRDSKVFQRYFKEERAPREGARVPDKKHPLPTSNMANEGELSDEELRAWRQQREFFEWRASRTVSDRVTARIAEQLGVFMRSLGFPERDHVADIHDFKDAFQRNPAGGERRTTATGSLLWVFILARTIDPKVIVESGVYKGASLYTLRAAVPGAKLYGFDIDLSNLVVKDPSIQLHEGDWSQAFPKSEGPEDFCYFDDHINNCQRLREAYDLGFRHVLIDDSPDIGMLHQWRYPGVPTIQMVVNRTLEPGEAVEWIWKRHKLRYVYREEETHGAADLVEHVAELPSVTALTGRRTGVQTYVRLKRKPG